MPTRPFVPTSFSERGSIRDLKDRHEDSDLPPDPQELHLKALYEQACVSRNHKMLESLGFIVMDEPGNQQAFPITLFRHREKLNNLSPERKADINLYAQLLEKVLFAPTPQERLEIERQKEKQSAALDGIESRIMFKRAGKNYQRSSFTRTWIE